MAARAAASLVAASRNCYGLASKAENRDPDRYFGIMSMYGNKAYLVGVVRLTEGKDEKAGRAGIAARMKYRETVKK